MINPHNTEVAKLENTDFISVDVAMAEDLVYVDFLDEIGYDWKELITIAPIQYRVDSDDTYVIKNSNGYYFKLRFLSFTNDQGLKGYPKFEFELL